MTDTTAAQPDAVSLLTRLDRWVESNPWHPRVLPFLVYILFLAGIDAAREHVSLWTYPFLYTIQCGLVVWLLWRYRRLLPELTLRFHWLAIPLGLLLCVAWVELGLAMGRGWPGAFAPAADEEHYFQDMLELSPALGWSSLVLRLLGMSLVVPLFEELFIRSAMLRGLQHARQTGVGLVQLLGDIPLIGEWVAETKVGRRAAARPPMFTKQLVETPVGAITFFGVAASTVVFMLSHIPRDWPGCIACGIAWCGLIWWTNRGPGAAKGSLGIGPVAWSHGVTNAALWYYTVAWGDWQFI